MSFDEGKHDAADEKKDQKGCRRRGMEKRDRSPYSVLIPQDSNER